jgi:hypothetical protein
VASDSDMRMHQGRRCVAVIHFDRFLLLYNLKLMCLVRLYRENLGSFNYNIVAGDKRLYA